LYKTRLYPFVTVQKPDFSQTLIPTLFINFSNFKKMGEPGVIKSALQEALDYDIFITVIPHLDTQLNAMGDYGNLPRYCRG
jgi:hypothetical protein